MEKPKDFYGILGVTRDASSAAIRRAYRRLARRFRPRAPGSTDEALRELQQAYETLSDDEQRRRYDESLCKPERREPATWPFLRSPGLSDLRRPLNPAALSGEVLLSASEARSGGSMPVEVPMHSACPACRGTGGTLFDCGRCGGDGRIERRLPVTLFLPPGVRDGAVFQVVADEPAVTSILLTVHVRPGA
jgi:molecular chaperone DnaJ